MQKTQKQYFGNVAVRTARGNTRQAKLMIPDAWNKCEIQDVSQGVGSAPAKYVNGCAVLLAQSRCKVAGSGKVREWEAGDRDVGG